MEYSEYISFCRHCQQFSGAGILLYLSTEEINYGDQPLFADYCLDPYLYRRLSGFLSHETRLIPHLNSLFALLPFRPGSRACPECPGSPVLGVLQ